MRIRPLFICKSHYTFLEGIHAVSDLVEFARDRGITPLCLADKNGLYGAVEFLTACRDAGIHPILGTELVQGPRQAILLARNHTGYEEMSEWVTRLHLDGLRIDKDLEVDSPNLLVLCRDPFLLQRWLKPGKNSLFPALTLTNRQACQTVLNLLSRRPSRQGGTRIPAVPVVEVNLLSPNDTSLYRMVSAIRLDCTVQTLPTEDLYPWEEALERLSPEIETDTPPYDPLLSGTDLAHRCQLELDVNSYHLPAFTPTE
ncbi:MAG: PHP domain-containing protein [Fidelibacterota bacterium]